MKNLDINTKYKEFCELIHKRQVNKAFELLLEIINTFDVKQFKFSIENYLETYKNILKYSFELVEDPEKEKIYNHLLKSLLELADEIKEAIIGKNKYFTYYNYKREIASFSQLTEEESSEIIDNIEVNKEFAKIIDNTIGVANEDNYNEENIKNVFKIIWFTNKFKEAETNLVKKLCQSDVIPWYDKSLIVSALTLSLHRYFDFNKFKLLFDFYEKNEEQIWQRALVGIFTGLLQYDQRITFYPELIFKLQELSDNTSFKKDIENIIIQYIRSKETEKVTKKLKEEIIPEMIKYKSKLVDKLDLDKIVSENLLEDKNPEWETVFEDSPGLYDKLEEFSKLQMEGADVFISAFSMLKHFDFFQQFSNWFLPFHKENRAINESISDLGESINKNDFFDGLEKTTFLCNSDKYSFCLNINFLPSSQKVMIANLFNMELEAMNDLEKDEGIINNAARNKAIFKQYIQDLYRFYKLHPLKTEFHDIFEIDIKFKDSILFNTIIEDISVLRNIGEFYFEKNDYSNAVEIFMSLSEKNEDFELVEKTAYSYQQLGEYNNALKYYLKSELFDKDKLWVLKKIAFCYRMTGEFNKAIDYLIEAERLDPDDLYIQAYLGHSYMDIKEYEKALKYYYKVEYLAPDNHKIQRPIAWCSFILEKYDASKKYFTKLIEKENNKNDYLNLGHVEWCNGNKKEAIKNYKLSIIHSNFDYDWFEEEYLNDCTHLINHGINVIDIPLMIDFVKISSKSK